MIACFPEIYPDELAYSWFCRYYVHSGCLTHKMALSDILFKRCNTPSKEFLGHLNPKASGIIQKMYPIEEIVLKHTMFPQYARFVPPEQKRIAFHRLCNDFCDFHRLFPVPARKESDARLKFCPMCAREDRENYGETYWHRVHQVRNMQICPRHHCFLENSCVGSESGNAFILCPAEFSIKNTEPKMTGNLLKSSFSSYIAEVFQSDINFHDDTPVRSILYMGMLGGPYLSASGKTRKTAKLSDDLLHYYQKTELPYIASACQVQRALTGAGFDFTVICQIAFLIGIRPSKLTRPRLSRDQAGLEMKTHCVRNSPVTDWNRYDSDTAPGFEKTVRAIYDGSASKNGRPERVSERIIYRETDIPKYKLDRLPRCKAIFEKFSEPYEENWARRIIWAYDKLTSEKRGAPIYWSDIRAMTGVKRESVEDVIPYIRKHAPDTDSDKIIALLRDKTE